MAATFLLIRHAAHADLDICLSGRRPGVPLSEAGCAQAARLGAYLARAGISAVETSPLDRTRATAAAVAEAAGLPAPTPVDALTEIDLGEWTGRDFASLHGDPAWTAWNEHRATARPPGGESMGEATARIMAHLAKAASANDGRVLAMVTHSDMIRGAVADVLGLSLDRVHQFTVDPASVTRIEMGAGAGGAWSRIQSLNEGAR